MRETNDNQLEKLAPLSCVVLLVDDQAIVAEGIRRMLESEDDIDFHYCADPTQAIDMAKQTNATVILQDLIMPDVDGMTLVRFFRANPHTREVPIIVLSSKEDVSIKSEAFSNGANDYLVKLPDRIELIARIRAHTRHYLTQLERDAAIQALKEMQKQLETSNRELQRLSTLDGLTGIANRRQFDDYFDIEWKRALRDGKPLSLLLIDIDYFKRYNDSQGHIAGDDCLKRVANILQSAIHRPADLVARYGGEEFAVVLPDTVEDGARLIAQSIGDALKQEQIPHPKSDIGEHISVSIGVTSFIPEASCKPEKLIDTADKALYEAKHKGRDQAYFLPCNAS